MYEHVARTSDLLSWILFLLSVVDESTQSTSRLRESILPKNVYILVVSAREVGAALARKRRTCDCEDDETFPHSDEAVLDNNILHLRVCSLQRWIEVVARAHARLLV